MLLLDVVGVDIVDSCWQDIDLTKLENRGYKLRRGKQVDWDVSEHPKPIGMGFNSKGV